MSVDESFILKSINDYTEQCFLYAEVSSLTCCNDMKTGNGEKEITRCVMRAVNGMKMVLSGNFCYGFCPENWDAFTEMSEAEMKKLESQVYLSYTLLMSTGYQPII